MVSLPTISPDLLPYIARIIESPECPPELWPICRDGWGQFKPREDDPVLDDWQGSFIADRSKGIAFFLKGNACLWGGSLIYDPVAKLHRRLDTIAETFHVWSLNIATGRREVCKATRPFVTGWGTIYEVGLSNGQRLYANARHRVLDCRGTWVQARQLRPGDSLSLSEGFCDNLDANEYRGVSEQPGQRLLNEAKAIQFAHRKEDRQDTIAATHRLATAMECCLASSVSVGTFRDTQRERLPCRFDRPDNGVVETSGALDCQDGYSVDRGLCDELLLLVEGSGLVSSPSQDGVHGCNHRMLRMGGQQALLPGYSLPCRSSALLSSVGSFLLSGQRHALCSPPGEVLSKYGGRWADILSRGVQASRVATRESLADRQLFGTNLPNDTKPAFPGWATDGEETALHDPPKVITGGDTSVYVTFVRPFCQSYFWNLTTTPNHNYLAAGLCHANCGGTTSAACKAARFLLSTPPPRKDTPFWIIGDTLEQSMDVCWGEKLMAEGHLPRCEVDWRRIKWYSEALEQPRVVPLRPWPGKPDCNWKLEFKSHEQGRSGFQAKSIGGFWFSEQFPYTLLLEVFRGVRKYSFPGGQFCEFTPLEPELCVWMQNVIDEPPPGWHVYYGNTEANRPNLAEGWYEQFAAAVPDEIAPTRLRGKLAGFEGVIYQSFRPSIHVPKDGAGFDFPPNVTHSRGIDWGASEEHPWYCVWGYKDGIGDWCYAGDMEVLTSEGWMRFDALTGKEVVATANISTPDAVMEWQLPTRYHVRPYSGKMFRSNGKKGSVRFCVTPDHDMVLKINGWGSNAFKKFPIAEMPLSRNYRIPISWAHGLEDDRDVSFSIGGITTTRGAFAKFLGVFLAEGCLQKGSVQISQKVLADEVEDMLRLFCGRWRRYDRPDGLTCFHLCSRQLVRELISLGLNAKSKHKAIPRFLFGWGLSLQSFLEGFEAGDGLHNDPRGQRQLFTISDQLANDLTEVCARLGLPTTMCKQDRPGFSPCHRIYIRKSKGAVPAQLTLSKEWYDGHVYCLTVPNGTLIVRHNGGTPFICGNCIYDEYWSIDQTAMLVDHATEIIARSCAWGWPIPRALVIPSARNEYLARAVNQRLEELGRFRSPLENHNFGYTYADPSRPGEIASFSTYGVLMANAANEVYQGINCVRALLKVNPFTGQPRLHIHPRCVKLIETIQKYRWKPAARWSEGAFIAHAVPAPQPLKRDDDPPDALRYMVFSESRMQHEAPGSTDRRALAPKRKSVQLDKTNGEIHGRGGQGRGWRKVVR